ncbi:hypothetical protein HK102_000493 [Quaeritorhiza haematococci]|nr:hypothetical protein HK102_000493 [Quaeritorhiza haematococci]
MRQNLPILVPALAAIYSAVCLGAPVDNTVPSTTTASPNPETTPAAAPAAPVEEIPNASDNSQNREFEFPFFPIPVIPGQPIPGAPSIDSPFPGLPGFPFPGQPQPGFPFPGQPQPGFPFPGQPQPGFPFPGQPQPGFPFPPTFGFGPRIENVELSGTGCPPGSVGAYFSGDGSALIFEFSQFSVGGGPGMPFGFANSKECTVTLKIRTPSRSKFFVQYVNTRGWYQLQDGIVVHNSVKISYPPHSEQPFPSQTIIIGRAGQTDSLKVYSENALLFGIPPSPCASESEPMTMAFNAALSVTLGDLLATGYMFSDPFRKIVMTVGLTWSSC